jgi:superfamily II DNA or RNA helicase
MKLISNQANQRVIDALREKTDGAESLDVISPDLSLFAFAAMGELLRKFSHCRMLLAQGETANLLGADADRANRNQLTARRIAIEFADWLARKASVKLASGPLTQALFVLRDAQGTPVQVISGDCPLTSAGLGVFQAGRISLVQATEATQEAALFAQWFEQAWDALPVSETDKAALVAQLKEISADNAPSLIYALILHHVFKGRDNAFDEDKVIKAATGFRETLVWKKLFKFQRDGVIGAIDKLERFGGCIIADSVGLGKTFEALAVIKYHELRNDRVLVLVPKRLRDNWTLYKTNDRRNFLASDRFNYDVLNHTDLSRENGKSGDVDLANINWGNYDLVVIDESHNFRNKATHNDRETRYDRLMRRIIKSGVKTRVLMLSATPVNNRLADLRNQIAFVTEGNDDAFAEQGIESIDETIRKAQMQFNRWQDFDKTGKRTPARLVEMLGFDYFKLLDLLTIARSRKHIEKYYGTAETGKFPERLKPVNYKPDVDIAGEFPSIRRINDEIRRLTLAAYAPLRYVLAHKRAAYDEKYSTMVRGGEGCFRQADREENLVHLIRVNVLKRMESSVSSFALTVKRQLADVENTLTKVEAAEETFEEMDIANVDIDDPAFESMLVGRKVKVLLQDVDIVRWRQDLQEDRNRLRSLLSAASQISAERDAKLAQLRETIAEKVRNPFNAENKKIIVFTAFADTANYLYENLSQWALETLGVHSALVTGGGHNQVTDAGLRKDFVSILTAFSPRSKERPDDLSGEGEVDLLVATDCISEGQNLQDCDFLVNYDIHWNPVRIIQRFGRIDRIGSHNKSIQLVNFWPNIELEEYINLEQRVSGRMVLLDVSATGEENIIVQQSGDPMNDLEYRRAQLLKLQDAVIDLEDLESGVSITDLTLNDFRLDLSRHVRENENKDLDKVPCGAFAVLTTPEAGIAPGVIFCLRAEGEAAKKSFESGYPLEPYYLVHVGDDGVVQLPFVQTKALLDRIKRLSVGSVFPDAQATERFNRRTANAKDMSKLRKLLAAAVASISGKTETRAVESLFHSGGTIAAKGSFAGINDFEVIAYLVILPEGAE